MFTYIAPDGKHPREGGILDQDFVKEVFGLKKYAYNHLGWGGDEAFLKELHDMNSPRSSRRRSHKHSASTSGSESQKKSPRKRASKAHLHLVRRKPKRVRSSPESRTEAKEIDFRQGTPRTKRRQGRNSRLVKLRLGLRSTSTIFQLRMTKSQRFFKRM